MTIVGRVRRLLETATGQSADAEAARSGLTVQRLPWGGRRYGHPMVPVYAERRRWRIAAGGGDELDGVMAAMPTGQIGDRVCWVCRKAKVGRHSSMCPKCTARVRDVATEQARPGYGLAVTAH